MTVKAPEATRARILEAAFEEIHHKGFQAASLSAIVERAEITKGALFHHFKGKTELGYAVVDQLIHSPDHRGWIEPFMETDDPIAVMTEVITQRAQMLQDHPEIIVNGCPVNNIAQEMAPLDNGFRLRIEKIYAEWRTVLAEAFRRGIAAGKVRSDVDPEVIAFTLVSMLGGGIGQIKTAQSLAIVDIAREGVIAYVRLLKP